MTQHRSEFKPGDRIGRYVVVRELGRGKSGAVYLAEQAILKRKVAVNVLQVPGQAMASCLGRTAELMARVDHPNIASLLDVGEQDGCPYLVVEYVEGQSLAQFVKEGEQPALPVMLRVVAAVCGGLQHAHEKGAVYQEISPESIYVGPSGQPVLVDFGMERLFSGVLEGEAVMRPGPLPLRVAPERARAERPSPLTDVWAVGQLLYELIGGRLPYRDAHESLADLASSDPVNLSPLAGKAPDFVIEIIGRCLEKDPAKRYASADELRRALEAAVDHIEMSESDTVALPAPSQGRTLLLHVEYQESELPGAYRQYQIGPYLGGGSYGEVFRARELLSGREVALKILRREWVADAEAVARFRREATLLARLSHPNVVRVQNFGRYGPSFFIAMDYLEGPTLGQVIAESAPMNLSDVTACAVQLAAGLAAVHKAEAIHRDIKPDNIRKVGERFVILDFGMAHVREADRLTLTGAVLGSPAYMSPEQALGLPVTASSDVYSLGTILYEMLSGKLPHQADSSHELLRKIAEEPPEPIGRRRSDLPAPLVELLDRALAKNPQERPSARRIREFFSRSAWMIGSGI